MLSPSLGWPNTSESGWCVQVTAVLEERLLLWDWPVCSTCPGIRDAPPACLWLHRSQVRSIRGVHSPFTLITWPTRALSGARSRSGLKSSGSDLTELLSSLSLPPELCSLPLRSLWGASPLLTPFSLPKPSGSSASRTGRRLADWATWAS